MTLTSNVERMTAASRRRLTKPRRRSTVPGELESGCSRASRFGVLLHLAWLFTLEGHERN